MHTMYGQTNNQDLKQAIAWELVLWFANKQTENGAFQALLYVQKAKEAKLNSDNRRKITIIEAECYLAINEKKIAKQLLELEMSNRSEEHTSELQSRGHLVCRLLLEKKKKIK